MTAPFIIKATRIILFSLIIILLLSFILAGILPWVYKQFDHEPWAIDYSPDRRFRVEYYAIPFLPFRLHYYKGMGCTDCPGYVRLLQNIDGKILQEKYFQMSHDISNKIIWEEDNVSIKLFVSWPLPK